MNGRPRALTVSANGIFGVFLMLSACTGPGGPREDNGQAGSRTELAESQLKAPLAGAYKVKRDGSRVPPEEKELPIRIGSGEAHWYRSGGVYVVIFRGLDPNQGGPLCLGSSVQTDSGLEHVTNSPTRGEACKRAPNLARPSAGVRTCGELLFYITEIPDDTEGDLFASVERYAANGTIIGVIGVVNADKSKAPEIDVEAEGYALPEGLIEGTTQVTC
jgi:hypothetical protein